MCELVCGDKPAQIGRLRDAFQMLKGHGDPMAAKRLPVRKVKPTPKKGIAVSHEEDHPAGLWMDPEIFARMNGRTAADPRRETFEVSNRYLQLASLVLGPEEEKKTRPGRSKRAKRS